MGGLFGIWDWSRRQPSAVERTAVAVVILIAAVACTAALTIGISQLMRLLLPAH